MKFISKTLLNSILIILFIVNKSVIAEDYDEGEKYDKVVENENIDDLVDRKTDINESETGIPNQKSFTTETSYITITIVNETDFKLEKVGEDEVNKESNEEEYYSEEEESQGNDCSVDYFIDKLTPDDYEDGKSGDISKNVDNINETVLRINRLVDYSTKVFDKITPFVKRLGSRISDILFEIDLQPECLKSIFMIMDGIRRKELWALKFIDSMGSLKLDGILDGVFSSLGEFDECLDIESPKSSDDSVIKGKYCLLKPIIPVPKVGSFKIGDKRRNFSIEWLENRVEDRYINSLIETFEFLNRTIFRFGICIPSTCSQTEIENAINKVLFPKLQIPFEVGPDCSVKNERPSLNGYQLFSLSIIGILSLIVIISTIFEIYFRKWKTNHFDFKDTKDDNYSNEFLTSFSIIKNTRTLFDKNDERFASMDTMRLLMIIWIFIMNSYLWTVMYGYIALKRVFTHGPYKILDEWKYFPIRLPQLVDILFLISGLTLTLSFRKDKEFSYFSFVTKRWIRFTPILIGSILFIYLCPLFGDGPFWDLSVDLLVDPCKRHILPTLFYYNNYNGNVENTCNIPSVYLSAAFQLHLIAPMIVIPLMKLKPNIAIVFNIICVLIGCLICTLPKLIFGLKTPYEINDMNSFQEMKHSFMQYWMGTHQHISTYSIGLLIGYLIRYKPNMNFGGKFGETLIWIFAPMCTVLAIVWNERFKLTEQKTNHLENMIWLAFGKVLWSSGFAWILYMCCTGRGGFVNCFLSFRFFQPLARLSFEFYLISPVVVLYRLYSVKQTFIMTDEIVFRGIATDWLIINFFSFILYILVESPVNNLMKIALKDSVTENNIDFDTNPKHKSKELKGTVGIPQVLTDNKVVICLK